MFWPLCQYLVGLAGQICPGHIINMNQAAESADEGESNSCGTVGTGEVMEKSDEGKDD
jgi:hypothetical protein